MLLATVSVYIRDHHCIVQNEGVPGIKHQVTSDKALDSPINFP